MLLEFDGRGPKYGQITRALLRSIQDGLLPPGTRLRSSRQVATELSCSRNIVLLAYEQLILEGYLISVPKRGTFVSSELPRPALLKAQIDVPTTPAMSGPMLSSRGAQLVAVAEETRAITRGMGRAAIDFVYGVSEPDARVVGRLRACFSAALKNGALSYADPAGDLQLREQVAERLRGSRGIVCSPEQIVITSGAQQGLDICARLLVAAGDRVVVEDPGYAAARAVFEAAEATIIPVGVDADGLDPAQLPGGRLRVRVAYVTPSHQFPTGATLPAPRRLALLAWARRSGTVIIEDDYDGDLRYHGRPLKALAALDPDGLVVYCGTFAKSLFPAIRLGYLVLPHALAPAAVHAKWLTDLGSSALLQGVVRDLMISGEYDRHIGRMRRRYATRRDHLIRTLTKILGADGIIGGSAAGLHLVVWLARLDAANVDRLVAACATRGVGVYAIGRHALRPLPRAGLIMGYGLTNERAIERGVRELAQEYRQLVESLDDKGLRRVRQP